MALRFSCLFGFVAVVLLAVWYEPGPARRATALVLGTGWSLADVVSGTYARPEDTGRKAKPRAVAQKTARKSKKGSELARRNLGDGYRTVCVRLCDGYYFPVSAAATPAEFERDERACQSSCTSPAKLFVYRNKDGAPETMTDLTGLPYADLANAFQYRASYESSCTCTPAPWTEAAANRHRLYAAKEAASQGDHSADLARIPLEAAVRAEERQARARTGADLVVARAPEMKSIAEAHRSLKRRLAERTPAVERKARVVRTATAQPGRVRAMRSAAAFAAPRSVRMTRRAGAQPVNGRSVRLSESRGVILVTR